MLATSGLLLGMGGQEMRPPCPARSDALWTSLIIATRPCRAERGTLDSQPMVFLMGGREHLSGGTDWECASLLGMASCQMHLSSSLTSSQELTTSQSEKNHRYHLSRHIYHLLPLQALTRAHLAGTDARPCSMSAADGKARRIIM